MPHFLYPVCVCLCVCVCVCVAISSQAFQTDRMQFLHSH